MRLFLPPATSYQVSTGTFATVNDSTQYNPLGLTVDDLDTSGRVHIYRYVKLSSTGKPSLIVGPVYYTDNTFTIVSPTLSEGGFGANGVAGLLLNASASYGNYVWIKTYGYQASVVVCASTAIGDALIGTTGNQTFDRVASGTAPTFGVCALALTAVSSTKSDILVCAYMPGMV